MNDSYGWTVYMLSCANDNLYCGITNNLDKRIKQHNGELHGGARYTRANRPCSLVFQEPAKDRSAALIRESEIKKLKRKDKIKLIDLKALELSMSQL
jgi:putative endonuclease